jgi:hypothetical protein
MNNQNADSDAPEGTLSIVETLIHAKRLILDNEGPEYVEKALRLVRDCVPRNYLPIGPLDMMDDTEMEALFLFMSVVYHEFRRFTKFREYSIQDEDWEEEGTKSTFVKMSKWRTQEMYSDDEYPYREDTILFLSVRDSQLFEDYVDVLAWREKEYDFFDEYGYSIDSEKNQYTDFSSVDEVEETGRDRRSKILTGTEEE